ncbi:MAG: hypothetical protein IKC64_02320 [Clostridia bacterium]|nr:hypothetical protein [Clostridia bacterium]
MKELYEFIIFILGGLGKILKFLLFKIGLWVPLLFSTLFLVVIAITQTPFEGIASLFWFGVILTTILSVVGTIGIAIGRGKKKRAEKRSAQSAVKPNDGEEQSTPPAPQYAPYGYGYPGYPPYPYPPQVAQQPAPYPVGNATGYPPQPQTQSEQPAQTDRPTFTSESNEPSPAEQSSTEGFSRRARFSEGFSAESYACPQGRPPESFNDYSFGARDRARFDEATRTSQPQAESPKIFRTRKDPSILIYDYSNRIEFYRQTPSGLQFLYKEDKN